MLIWGVLSVLRQTQGTVLTVLQASSGRKRGAGDGRQAATMWALLVWAYKRELVRHCEGRIAADYAPSGSSLGLGRNTATICRMLEEGGLIHGGLAKAGRVPVHADAEWIHGLVRTLDRDEFWLIVSTAERDVPPDWNPHIEPAWTRGVFRANGKPKHILDERGRPIACRLETGGVIPEEAERIREHARETYSRWFRLLAALRNKLVEEDALTRWRVTGIGAEPMPWLK